MINLRKVFHLLFFFAFVSSSIADDGFEDCFGSQDNYRCRLGPMTPYRLVANMNDSELTYSGCAPQKIWLLLRHGTRYPNKKLTAKISDELPNIRDSIVAAHRLGEGKLSVREIELLKKWKFLFSEEDNMKLTIEGERELAGIAERFQSRFPSIMPEIYSNQTYLFKYTDTPRTEESAKSFALGLFGRQQSLSVEYPQPVYGDRILRFYKICKLWLEKVDKNPESYGENEKFTKSSIVDKLVDEVSKRAGFELNYDDVRLIYKMCGFETAWDGSTDSPWCSLLSLENFKVLEFEKDLQYYWIDGYGYPLTYKQACTAMNDMFQFFESNDDITTRAYFTHSGTLLKFLSLLGIANDENVLRHDSFLKDENRAWRTSLIDSFATNIAFVLYDCESQGPSILLMHQERVVQLPDCPVNRPCPLSTMKQKYPDNETECPFDEMCAIKD